MSVYLVTCREMGLVKIGHAAQPKRRFQGFKTGSPAELVLEATFEGGAKEERELHTRFAEHRERGEWFRLCPEIEELIEANKPKVEPKWKPFEQGDRVDAFLFDPEGWLRDNPGKPIPTSVQNWLDRYPEKAPRPKQGKRDCLVDVYENTGFMHPVLRREMEAAQ